MCVASVSHVFPLRLLTARRVPIYLSIAPFTLGVLIGFNPIPVAKLVPIHQLMDVCIEPSWIEPDWWAFTL